MSSIFRKPLTEKQILDAEKKPLWQRLAWLIAIWCLSVLALGIAAALMRLLMHSAGLTAH